MKKTIPECPNCGATTIQDLWFRIDGDAEVEVAQRDSVGLILYKGKATVRIGCGECGTPYGVELES